MEKKIPQSQQNNNPPHPPLVNHNSKVFRSIFVSSDFTQVSLGMQQPLQTWDSHTGCCKWNLQAASDTKCDIHTPTSQPGKPSAVADIPEDFAFPQNYWAQQIQQEPQAKLPGCKGKGWKGWDGKDKHHPEVFATSPSLPNLLCRSFIFCCSSEVETQIAAGVNKQFPSHSIINKVVPASSRASSEICLNVFSPKPGAQRFHFPILWVKSWNCAQETQCQTFIRKLKNLDFLQICLCWYKGNHCNAESLTAGNCCVTEKIFQIYFHPFQGVL